jgi:hypothetical protein
MNTFSKREAYHCRKPFWGDRSSKFRAPTRYMSVRHETVYRVYCVSIDNILL